MKRAVIVYAGLLLVALVLSYRSWTHEGDVDLSEATVVIAGDPEDLEGIDYSSDKIDVSLDVLEDAYGKYVWVTATPKGTAEKKEEDAKEPPDPHAPPKEEEDDGKAEEFKAGKSGDTIVEGMAPFVVKRPPCDRVERLLAVTEPDEPWVLGGALDGWGDALIERFDLVVFLRAPTEVRIDRLRERERRRFGRRVGSGGDMDGHHQRFLAWAASYDDATLTSGLRSRARHEAWLAMLPRPALRLDATRSVEALTKDVLSVLSMGSRRSA